MGKTIKSKKNKGKKLTLKSVKLKSVKLKKKNKGKKLTLKSVKLKKKNKGKKQTGGSRFKFNIFNKRKRSQKPVKAQVVGSGVQGELVETQVVGSGVQGEPVEAQAEPVEVELEVLNKDFRNNTITELPVNSYTFEEGPVEARVNMNSLKNLNNVSVTSSKALPVARQVNSNTVEAKPVEAQVNSLKSLNQVPVKKKSLGKNGIIMKSNNSNENCQKNYTALKVKGKNVCYKALNSDDIIKINTVLD
jgi:hypothetical protein